MPDWDETIIAEPTTFGLEDEQDRDRAYLIVLAGNHVGEMYKISRSELIIGRGSDCEIRVIDEGVSRQHARVRLGQDSIHVEDMGSRNGTYVNGAPIEAQQLRDGDKLQIGRTTILKFTYHDRLDESFQRQMYDSALRDPLTRAYNKRYFDERIESEFKFAVRHEEPLVILLLDLDHFKAINDTHGHLAGDHVLSEFARHIHETVRKEDVFARYGGEEFAIISRTIGLDNAKIFAERLCREIEELELEHGDQRIPLTVSIGVACYPEVRVDGPTGLIEAADRALYRAKSNGRNRYEVFDPADRDEGAGSVPAV